MKFLNDFKNLFAIVGVVSIIFWTCASESTSDTTNVNPPQLTGGSYQFQLANTSDSRVFVLNTETGVLKKFQHNTNLNEWVEQTEFTQTFTH